MASVTSTVTVRVEGGPSASPAWTQGMSALQAMELAQAIIEPAPDEQFTFALQYYGSGLGYLVCMINETYDSFISRGGEKATPFFYWNFLVNDKPAEASVDRTVLKAGDVITFKFEAYTLVKHAGSLLAAKHKFNI
jgi:hypothetical protein